jgi:predicted GNAT superfamily acetyltransferase
MSSEATGARLESDVAEDGEATRTELRMLHLPSEMVAATELVASVWQVDVNQSHVNPGLLTALAHAGNYVAGGFRGGELMAVCVGFFHPPQERTLHSHIAGVRSDAIGTGWGNAIKLHQRDWCLERGVTRVTWTYDPLIARNAYFNVHKLGCTIDAYLPDFYGLMGDGLNLGQPSDRVLAVWDLERPGPRPPAAPGARAPVAVLWSESGRPVLDQRRAHDLRTCRVEVPNDIEQVRRADPALAVAWREALREALGTLLADGWTVTDFDRRGHYNLTRST